MPVINGKVVRSRYTKLDLNELSSVDNPAQPGALAMIMKRAGPVDPPAEGSGLARAITKYIGSDDGAHTFEEVLAENKFDQQIWPMTDALSQSVRSVMGDEALTPAERDAKITDSVDQFLTAIRALDPPADGGETQSEKVEKQLRELISKKDDPMPKTVAELEAELAKAQGQITTLTGERDTEKARADKAETDLTTEKAAHVETKKALGEATEETLKVEGAEVKKSVVGEANFAIFKAQESRAETAEATKRAETEFGHVAGSPAEKALVLKALNRMDEDTSKALTAILTSAEKMAAGAFDRLGTGSELSPSVKAARATFMEKVAEIEKRDSCTRMAAMTKAEDEHPDLFEAYREAEQG